MHYSSDHDIDALILRFENRTLPKAEWTHAAHLTAGLYYLYHHDFYEALCILKGKIISYNVAAGGTNSPTEGYHETLTLFWLHKLQNFLAGKKQQPLHALCNELLGGEFSSRELPLIHYSREKLFSVMARATWIEPDLKPL